jgi:methyl-accepting chemotaxis protein PixJ
MTTPESMQDPVAENNGHHDYSESISDFLSDIDGLDDLDLSGIFNSKSSLAEEEPATEDLFAPNDSVAHIPVAQDLAVDNTALQDLVANIEQEPKAHVEMKSKAIGFETEAEPISTEVAQDLDSTNVKAEAANVDIEALHDEPKPARFETDAADTRVEQVLEVSNPTEAESVELATAHVLEPIHHAPVETRVESQDIETEPESIQDAVDAEFAEPEVNQVLETSHFQAEVQEVESQAADIAAAQVLEPAAHETVAPHLESNDIDPEVEAQLIHPEMDAKSAEPEAAQVSGSAHLEPAVAYLALDDIKTQVNSLKSEVKTESPKEEVIQNLEPIKSESKSDSAEVDSNKIQTASRTVAKLAPAAAKTPQGRKSKRLNLRAKATLLALAIGTLPVIATGTLAYFVTGPSVKQQVIKEQENRISEASQLANRFMIERYSDIELLAKQPIFTNTKASASLSKEVKQATLQDYVTGHKVYDSIALLDLEGNAIVHSGGKQLPNYKGRGYFQSVLKTQKPVISQPEASKVTGELSIFFAAPVFSDETGKMIAIVRSRMPVKYLYEVVEGHKFGDKSVAILQQVFLVDNAGKYFVANKAEEVGLAVEKDFSIFPQLVKGRKLTTEVYQNTKENVEELVSYSPGAPLEGLPNLNWSIMVASETQNSFAALNNLRLALIAGTAVAAILVGALAAYLASRATRPIIDSAEAVRKIGRGELDTRVSVSGQDELADLGTNINQMAEQLQASLDRQQQQTRERQLFAEISQARTPQALESPLNTLLAEIRAAMQLDRAVVYRFYPDWSGHIVGESVLPGWPIALADKIEDACIPQTLLDAYKKGRVVPTSDVFNAGFHPDHLDLMTRLQIKANLVVPILQGEELFGILVGHHCAETHDWKQSEIEYLQEAAGKMGAPLGSLALFERQEYEAEQERNRSQALQMELMNLLGDVQGASDGDLTVRADVSAGEIGIVADFFNSIVENLRDIVSQVKDASAQVNTSVSNNEVAMGQLADESQVQAQQITNTLKSVEQMALSIQEVAENARKASKVAGIASTTAESGGRTMDRTVDSILMLRETVAETAKKVKRLGESSQQISKAVSLINQIALQTNLLAINASIEAARAGKEGRGFAVVAEEVGALAAQSAEATKEIEQIVENIQSETGEVVDAMERGTTQVVEGTRQVEEAKESLQQIVKVSRQIDKLLQSISSATVSQTEASEVVKQLMQQVTQSSERASDTSRQVSGSLQETVAIAQRLQASVGTFKVEN